MVTAASGHVPCLCDEDAEMELRQTSPSVPSASALYLISILELTMRADAPSSQHADSNKKRFPKLSGGQRQWQNGQRRVSRCERRICECHKKQWPHRCGSIGWRIKGQELHVRYSNLHGRETTHAPVRHRRRNFLGLRKTEWWSTSEACCWAGSHSVNVCCCVFAQTFAENRSGISSRTQKIKKPKIIFFLRREGRGLSNVNEGNLKKN